MKLSSLVLIIFTLASANAVQAQSARRGTLPADFAPLDAPYPNLIHPKKSRIRPMNREELKSDVEDTLKYQTAVKSQGGRGTCSIFSATALLEGALARTQGISPADLDLSEEWLEYIAMQGKTSDGSHSHVNMRNLLQFGTVREQTWPYVGEDWLKDPNMNPAAKMLCGRFGNDSMRQASCFLGHRDPNNLLATDQDLLSRNSDTYDPQFQKVRAEATLFRDKYLKGRLGATTVVYNTDEIKSLLRAGHTLLLDHEFFYGAYNHRTAADPAIGLGRNLEHWNQGLIGYPFKDSADLIVSRKKPAGHSVLVVGYDDTRTITVTYKTAGGGTATRTLQGVYYIKNSWGSDSFGSQFEVNGVRHPGYGAFSQDYAHDYGSFLKTNVR